LKIALLADIHANLEALDACLAHAKERGAERWVFLGDLVGYGADPVAVVDRIQELRAGGAVVVRGNHDTAAAGDRSEQMNKSAEAALDWTHAQLSPAQCQWLLDLPLIAREDAVCFVHASAVAPEQWTYIVDPGGAARSLEAAGATYVFCGHVHGQTLYYRGAGVRLQRFAPTPGVPIPVPAHRQWLAIAGSVGQPRDGNTAACYAVFDQSRATLCFHRVPYNHSMAAAKIRAAGLPEYLARRLERGE